MTVPMTAAAVVRKAAVNVHTVSGTLHHLLYSAAGATKQFTKFIHTPVRKKPHMTWLAILINVKILLISLGSAIVAPLSSSFSKISTGLNQ
jgi:hypothetical protein